jgi:hypothetical protein
MDGDATNRDYLALFCGRGEGRVLQAVSPFLQDRLGARAALRPRPADNFVVLAARAGEPACGVTRRRRGSTRQPRPGQACRGCSWTPRAASPAGALRRGRSRRKRPKWLSGRVSCRCRARRMARSNFYYLVSAEFDCSDSSGTFAHHGVLGYADVDDDAMDSPIERIPFGAQEATCAP